MTTAMTTPTTNPTTTPAAPQRWIGRDELAAVGQRPGSATGLLRTDPTGGHVVGLSPADLDAARTLTAETLQAAGVQATDRVVVALNSDADLGGTLLAEAAAQVAEAATAPGPRGRMRLLTVLEAVRASVLVATPTGAADFLARLHLEFLVDPLDLELRQLVLTGEISDARTYAHLAKEFGAEVVELYTDPVTTVPVAHRRPASSAVLTETRPGLLHLLPLAGHDGLAEIAVAHGWHSALGGVGVRTGHVVSSDDAGIPAPQHTAGDLVLVRGRWLSISALTKALRGIDGISHWGLRISRDGTLDAAVLTVTFSRESLVGNGMWRARIEQAIAALTPVSIAVAVAPDVREDPAPPTVIDERGQHLPAPAT